jgi:hypothetical protein
MSSTATLSELFKTFNEAQQQRPGIYQSMKEAFEHRHEGCEHSYADRNKEIQQKHIEASKAVISVATTFEANPETSKVAALIRSLQLLEKDHLHGTIELYIMQQKYADQHEDYANFEEAEYEQALKSKQKQLRKIIEEINDILYEIKAEEISLLKLDS